MIPSPVSEATIEASTSAVAIVATTSTKACSLPERICNFLIPCSNLLGEGFVYLGTGAFGAMAVLQRCGLGDIIKYVGLTTAAAATLGILLSNTASERRKRNFSRRSVVFITGCDSGLGFNIAQLCHRLGLVVFAACLDPESEGAHMLQELDGGKTGRLTVIPLNITLEENVLVAHQTLKEYFKLNPSHELFAFVNNAGVMCFGEFEWLLDKHIDQQLGVNLLGTMKLTKTFLPLLRAHKSRLINVTSHCSLQALPGLSVYAASKAALRFWTDALRMEMSPYGVQVVNYIPGSMVMESNICANQQIYSEQMRAAFTQEQLEFYGSYFDEYNAYLKFISGNKPVASFAGNHPVMRTFADALLDLNAKAMYKCEPWRYQWYHFLFRVTPTCICDWLVRRFVSMPMYKSPEERKAIGLGYSL
ncbi:D-beta-hydroxybutyrate dehydrogenase, mitochondrial [Uranotaenia lowii]|uniref:D-beta-hydroxybutyrate dehydrogenase, mitochondrial n=1 Tax=Uranotaenia lowii TaxID=190385 RepID=UPI00247B058D|nr:D-beta-hydroxybutyrate dehydrogenase, mitochondrial [Uranotaenia lowii]XP_055601465.1 D-beta-hydroxybutyrate dehydrogenase, mitochondrial [Uranotaenia lowii]XP_055601472.1 D-beta-hydroxybutyrate dehydrogenase, mitochondrial [Uranotaenia lowii]